MSDQETALQIRSRWESNITFMYSQKWNCYIHNIIIVFCLPVPTPIYMWEIYAGKYVERSWQYINRSKTQGCRSWDWNHAIPRKGMHTVKGILVAVVVFVEKGKHSAKLNNAIRAILRIKEASATVRCNDIAPRGGGWMGDGTAHLRRLGIGQSWGRFPWSRSQLTRWRSWTWA